MQPLQSSQPSQSLQPDLSLTRPGTSVPRIIMLTVAAYRLLLALCPRELRHEYGTEMVQVLRQCCRDAYRRRRAWGVALLWLPTLGDVCLGAAAEYASLLLHTWKEIWFYE